MWGEPEVRNYDVDSVKDSFGFTLVPLDARIRMSNECLAPIRLLSIQLVHCVAS
jgi:hypothetical protein